MIKEVKISRRVGLIDLFKEKGFKRGVEIGTDRGGYALDILKRMPDVDLVTIDPWYAYKEGDEIKTQEVMENYFDEARHLLGKYKNCNVVRGTSMDCVDAFKDNSIDFVFIDGNHEYSYVYEDIREWTKKVRKGGIVSGHDYVRDDFRRYGVIDAVNRYVEENNIDLFIGKKGTFVPFWFFYKK